MAELAIRVVLSLALVLGLFWMVARTGSRKLGGRDRGLVRVRGRQSLSRSSSLAVVEVGNRVLVVGVSDGGVRLLTEMDPDELDPAAAPVDGVLAAAPDVAGPSFEDVYAAAYAQAYDGSQDGAHDGSHDGSDGETRPEGDEDVPEDESEGRVPAPDNTPTPTPPALPPALPVAVPVAARAARPAGGLSGSLLAGSTWRQAWNAATGRAHASRTGDAA